MTIMNHDYIVFSFDIFFAHVDPNMEASWLMARIMEKKRPKSRRLLSFFHECEAHNKEIVMAKASEHIFEMSFHRENGRISAGNLNSIATARQCCTMLLDK